MKIMIKKIQVIVKVFNDELENGTFYLYDEHIVEIIEKLYKNNLTAMGKNFTAVKCFVNSPPLSIGGIRKSASENLFKI